MGLPCDFVLAPACCVDVDLSAAPGRENALINKRAYKISKHINRTDSGIPKGSRPWVAGEFLGPEFFEQVVLYTKNGSASRNQSRF